MSYFLGIDPGQSGGMTLLKRKKIEDAFTFKDMTGAQVKDWLKCIQYKCGGEILAALELVHSMPKQGVSSSFKFGMHYGHCQGILDALEISYELVTPQKWQTFLGCKSGGNKNITKARAHREWPTHSKLLTHALADSALIALWLSRQQR